MKTTMIKSMMLIGLMSVSTVMFGNNLNNNEVKNNKSEFVHHSKHCKGWDCHDKHCTCGCHKTWDGCHGKDMNGHKMDGHKMDGHKDKNNKDMNKGMNNGGGTVKSGRR